MAEAFGVAATRHWNDAGLLFASDRFATAGYLAGYAVECSLKLLIEWTDMSPKSLSHDIGAISRDALPLAVLLTPSLGRYDFEESPELVDIMKGWSPELRYADNTHPDRVTSQKWLKAAEQVYLAVIVKLILDGHGAL